MLSVMNIHNAFKSQGYDEIPDHPLDRLKPLHNETTRKKTFENWPKSSDVNPNDLCADGFYYMGITDKVQCIHCGGVLSGWEHGDNIHQEHKKHFSKCPSLLSDIEADSVPGNSDGLDRGENDPNQADNTRGHQDRGYLFGEQTTQERKAETVIKLYNPSFSLYNKRLESFSNWPETHFLKPEDLAAAGLYYKGEGDKCQCYTCGGILEQWEEEDDPKTEHKQWFPKCARSNE